jgi:hypothetical protein
VSAEATTWAATAVATETRRVVEAFREACGRDGPAAAGAETVVAALNAARVDTLLVTGDAPEAPTAWFGPEPVPVAMDRSTLPDLGVTEVREAPLPDVLLRAALGTDASVRVVPGGAAPADGVGALLRW